MVGLGPIALIRKKAIANTDKKIDVFFMIFSPSLRFLKKPEISDYIDYGRLHRFHFTFSTLILSVPSHPLPELNNIL
jgi:hypothetical protein